MRIAVCGPQAEMVIPYAEKVLKTKVKDKSVDIISAASETYRYDDEFNVIFKGSAFDYLCDSIPEWYYNVYEQIALNTLNNLDYVAVILMDMEKEQQKIYTEYAELMPEKFHLYPSAADFDVTLK